MDLVDLTPRIVKFFDHRRFRGLWYVRRQEQGIRWTVTYLNDDNEYMETEDAVCWRSAMWEAMKECGV